jgi:hypothetical protein
MSLPPGITGGLTNENWVGLVPMIARSFTLKSSIVPELDIVIVRMESELTATFSKFRAGGVTEMIGCAMAAAESHKVKLTNNNLNFRLIFSPQQK